jgi:hypothetical protein
VEEEEEQSVISKKSDRSERQPNDPVLQAWNKSRQPQPADGGMVTTAPSSKKDYTKYPANLSKARSYNSSSSSSMTTSPKPPVATATSMTMSSVPSSPGSVASDSSNSVLVLQETLRIRPRSHSESSSGSQQQRQQQGEEKKAETPPYSSRGGSLPAVGGYLNRDGDGDGEDDEYTDVENHNASNGNSNSKPVLPPRLSHDSPEFYKQVLHNMDDSSHHNDDDDNGASCFDYRNSSRASPKQVTEQYLI